eukprot:7402602-Pyramimonas_sp.AAC.1
MAQDGLQVCPRWSKTASKTAQESPRRQDDPVFHEAHPASAETGDKEDPEDVPPAAEKVHPADVP